ncbi:unnamed protein product, partial [Larinioides sclopetarius]
AVEERCCYLPQVRDRRAVLDRRAFSVSREKARQRNEEEGKQSDYQYWLLIALVVGAREECEYKNASTILQNRRIDAKENIRLRKSSFIWQPYIDI